MPDLEFTWRDDEAGAKFKTFKQEGCAIPDSVCAQELMLSETEREVLMKKGEPAMMISILNLAPVDKIPGYFILAVAAAYGLVADHWFTVRLFFLAASKARTLLTQVKTEFFKRRKKEAKLKNTGLDSTASAFLTSLTVNRASITSSVAQLSNLKTAFKKYVNGLQADLRSELAKHEGPFHNYFLEMKKPLNDFASETELARYLRDISAPNANVTALKAAWILMLTGKKDKKTLAAAMQAQTDVANWTPGSTVSEMYIGAEANGLALATPSLPSSLRSALLLPGFSYVRPVRDPAAPQVVDVGMLLPSDAVGGGGGGDGDGKEGKGAEDGQQEQEQQDANASSAPYVASSFGDDGGPRSQAPFIPHRQPHPQQVRQQQQWGSMTSMGSHAVGDPQFGQGSQQWTGYGGQNSMGGNFFPGQGQYQQHLQHGGAPMSPPGTMRSGYQRNMGPERQPR